MTLHSTTGQAFQFAPGTTVRKARNALRLMGWRLTTDGRGRLVVVPLH